MRAGLFGTPIQNSLSPELHNKWFKQNGLQATYSLLETETEDAFLRLARQNLDDDEFLGGNITVPFKEKALLLDKVTIDEAVRKIGAGNVFYRDENRHWRLGNTDVDGVMDTLGMLKDSWNSDRKPYSLVVLGSGGTARAIIYATASDPLCSSKTIVSRNPEQVRSLWKTRAHNKNVTFLNLEKFLTAVPSGPVVIANTIPREAAEHDASAIAILEALQPKPTAYFDVSYLETKSLAFAKSRGATTSDGKNMLLIQAARSFELWTGIFPNLD